MHGYGGRADESGKTGTDGGTAEGTGEGLIYYRTASS